MTPDTRDAIVHGVLVALCVWLAACFLMVLLVSLVTAVEHLP